MQIRSIRIANFRAFESLDFRPRTGMNVLVGENSAGKSTIFTCLSMLLASVGNDSRQFSHDDLRYGQFGSGTLARCQFALDHDEQQGVLLLLMGQQFSSTKSEQTQARLQPILQDGELVCDWQGNNPIIYVRLGPFFIQGRDVRNGPSSAGRRTRPLFDLLAAENPEDTVKQADVWTSDRDLQRLIGELLISRYRIFSDFRARPKPGGRSGAVESFQGGDTSSVLLNLKNSPNPSLRARYSAICARFSTFFPNLHIEAVDLNPGAGNADIQFLESGHPDYPIPLMNVGAGTAELLTLVTNLVARDQSVLVIEEPELHLHPHARRQLQDLILETSQRNQVFVLTHDPYFVRPESLEGLVRIYASSQGSRIAPVIENLDQRTSDRVKSALRTMEKREVVFSRAALLVEDESQRNFIIGCQNALGIDLDRNSVSVIDYGGQDGWRPYVDLVKALKIPFLCLRDNAWGQPSEFPPSGFLSLGCELEEFLAKEGLSDLMDRAKPEVGTAKQRVAAYVGEHITRERVPAIFSKLIADAVALSNTS